VIRLISDFFSQIFFLPLTAAKFNAIIYLEKLKNMIPARLEAGKETGGLARGETCTFYIIRITNHKEESR